jgi:ABC-type phosphate transport system substrate-binding protein
MQSKAKQTMQNKTNNAKQNKQCKAKQTMQNKTNNISQKTFVFVLLKQKQKRLKSFLKEISFFFQQKNNKMFVKRKFVLFS